MNLDDIASGLVRHEDGYWVADHFGPVSYPQAGNDFCLSVEDDSFWFAHRNRAIIAAVRRYPPAAGAPLLDLGAGNGFVSAALQAAGFPVVAIEPNPAGTRNAVDRQVRAVICGMLPSQKFRHATAGAIGLFDVVEHVEDDLALLQGVNPYLRRGGRIYLTVPAYQSLWSHDDTMAGHYRRYSLSRVCMLLRDAGYKVDYGTYIFSWLPLPILALRALPSRLGRRRDVPARAEHAAGLRWFRKLLEQTLSFEPMLIAGGAAIPFGASCLVVATSR